MSSHNVGGEHPSQPNPEPADDQSEHAGLAQIQVVRDEVRLSLSEVEALIISDLMEQVRTLLGQGQNGPLPQVRLNPDDLGLADLDLAETEEPEAQLGLRADQNSPEHRRDEQEPASSHERCEQPVASADDLEALVGMRQGPQHMPHDPALARLLPDAYADNAAASADFRRFTEDDLRKRKRANLETALATLSPFAQTEQKQPDDSAGVSTDLAYRQRCLHLDAGQAQAWLGALNDVRLVMGARLGVSDDDDGGLDQEVVLWLDQAPPGTATDGDEDDPAAQRSALPVQAGVDARALQAVFDYLTIVQENLLQAVCVLDTDLPPA